MRKLMWFSIGYAAACGLGTYLLRGRGLLVLAGILLVLSAGSFFLRKYPLFRRGAAALLGCAIGCGWFFGYEQAVLLPLEPLDEQIIPVEVRVTDYSFPTDYGSAVDGTVRLQNRDYKMRFYLKGEQELVPGQVVKTEARLRLTDGGSREPTFHRADGVLLLGYQRGDAVFLEGERELADRLTALRHRFQMLVQETFPEDTFAFAKALVLGDKTDLSHAQTTAFSVSGISHIVAVSGLHVSILCAMVYFLSQRRRFLTVFLGMPLLILFAAVVGFTPSVTRSVLMQLVLMLGLLLDREYDPPTALAFASMVMLTACPLVIASVGFQLSAGSVAGIFLFYRPIYKWLQTWLPGKGKSMGGRLERWLGISVAVTLSATVVTTPLVAVYFQTVSLVSPLTNLLVLFAVSGIFCGVVLACLVGLVHPGLAKLIAEMVSLPIRYVLGTAEALASFPLAAVYTDSGFIVGWLVFVYVLLLWLLVSKKKHPVWAASLAAAGLCVSLVLSWRMPWRFDYRVTVLDVGQGQCVLLQSDGCTFLVDCGGSSDTDTADLAARTLMSQGVFRIDGLILTHYDRDHAGGVADLAQRVDIDRLYLPQTEDADGMLETLLAIPAEQIPIEGPIQISFGETKIFLYPAKNAISGNDSSASVLFQRGKYDTLITGDLSSRAELLLLEEYDFPDLEVLLVGHHGSKYSTCEELLEATAPDVAIISVGANNTYGHPTQEVLERLEQAGCAVYRTDLHGTVTYRR